MKKFITLALIFILLLSSFTACDTADSEATTKDQSPPGKPQESDFEFLACNKDYYTRFDEAVSSNKYDAYLSSELEKSKLSPTEIYTVYLNLWEKELLYTVSQAEPLFDDNHQYLSWKNECENWMSYTESIYELEVSTLSSDNLKLELLKRYADIVRTQSIHIKFFCYLRESQFFDVYYRGREEYPIGLRYGTENGTAATDYLSDDIRTLKEPYLGILLNTTKFSHPTTGNEISLSNYVFPCLNSRVCETPITQYAINDIDGDGNNELAVSGGCGHIIVIRFDNGICTSYELPCENGNIASDYQNIQWDDLYDFSFPPHPEDKG